MAYKFNPFINNFDDSPVSGASVVTSITTGAGSATAPGVQVGTGTTYKPGIYSPGTDQLAISTGGTGRLFVDSSGRILVGTSTANTSGAKLQTSDGITFPATQVASSDPNTLDDYEEGSWTPVVTSMTTTGTPGYGGRYRKIGSQVTIWFFTTTASGVATYTAISNSTNISGLPFASAYDGVVASGGPPGFACNGNFTAGAFLGGPGPASGSSTMYFASSLSSTIGISISLTYYV